MTRRAHSAQVVLAVILTAVATSCSSSSPRATTATTVTTAGNPGQTTPATRVPPDRFGIAAGVAVAKADQATMNRELDGEKAVGATWLRTTIKWNVVQPDNHTSFDWTDADRLIDAARQRGLQLDIIVNGTPNWALPSDARDDPAHPPANLSDYADFLRAAVTRYKDRVHYWELGNEPNHVTGWSPTPDPARYAELLRTTYPVIKTADPNAAVLIGGIGGEQNSANRIPGDLFLQALYQNGAKGFFDIVSYHPYTYPSLASQGGRSWQRMLNARRIMEQNGDASKQIWATEYGAPTNGPRPRSVVSEAKQAAMVSDAYTLFASYPWSGPMFWFTFHDKGTDTSDQQNFFGLVNADFTPKPAYHAYKLAATGQA